MDTPILTSYDDYIQPDIMQYWFERLTKCVESCKEFSQMKAMDNAIKLFRKKYPKEKALSQTLYRKFWQIKRGFINN